VTHGFRGVACTAAVAAVAVGLCGSAGAAPGKLVPQGKIKSIVLSKDAVSSIVGATLTSEQTYPVPETPPNTDNPKCNALFGFDSGVVGANYEAFEDDYQQDGDQNNFNHLVVQEVAIYPDVDTAAKQFQAAYQGVSSCATVNIPAANNNPGSTWQFQPPTVAANHIQSIRSSIVNGQPNGWRCASDGRVQSNVMFDVVSCQYGNPIGVVSQVADQMAAAASS
jgi:hypothetical protein